MGAVVVPEDVHARVVVVVVAARRQRSRLHDAGASERARDDVGVARLGVAPALSVVAFEGRGGGGAEVGGRAAVEGAARGEARGSVVGGGGDGGAGEAPRLRLRSARVVVPAVTPRRGVVRRRGADARPSRRARARDVHPRALRVRRPVRRAPTLALRARALLLLGSAIRPGRGRARDRPRAVRRRPTVRAVRVPGRVRAREARGQTPRTRRRVPVARPAPHGHSGERGAAETFGSPENGQQKLHERDERARDWNR